MADLSLTIALERYDRHLPFFMGTVTAPPRVAFNVLEVGVGNTPGRRDGIDRHGRMFRDQAFDVCEQSLSSYIMAKSRGMPFTATPVFPRRLFSQNHIFVNVDAGIEQPSDLVGKRVGVWSFQNTLGVRSKGDLKRAYGVPWEQIHWHTQNIELIPWEHNSEISVQRIPPDKNAGRMLVDGELDAMIHPQPPPEILDRTDRVRRLFPNARSEALKYLERFGYYPIMHVLIFPSRLVDQEPWLPGAMIEAWNDSKAKADAYYGDPGFLQIAFARNEYEKQRDQMGADLFPSGIAANRACLEDFIEDMADQRLIERPLPVEAIFHESVGDS